MGVEKAKFTWITWTDEFDSKIKQRTPADSGRIDVFPLTPIRQQFYRYARTKSDYDLYDKSDADSLKRILCIPNRLDANRLEPQIQFAQNSPLLQAEATFYEVKSGN